MTNYGGLITQRLLLVSIPYLRSESVGWLIHLPQGACEAALFPCLIIYLSMGFPHMTINPKSANTVYSSLLPEA
jgi:hypothetical protein